MRPGRDRPCPCGSGKSYADCCQPTRAPRRARREVDSQEALRILVEAAPAALVWAADVVRLASPGRRGPDAAALLVTAGPVVVQADLLTRIPSAAADVAATLERAVLAASRDLGLLPEELHVRDAAVAERLGEEMAARDVRVVSGATLPGLDEAAEALLEHLSRASPFAAFAAPPTWAGWGLPPARVASLFRAAAAFHRAAPWDALGDSHLLLAETAEGRSWVISLTGRGGGEAGLLLFAELADCLTWMEAEHPLEAIEELRGAVFSLGFVRGKTLPVPMRREVREAGWEVSGPDAWPVLLPLSPPARALTARDAADLEAILRGVPAMVAAHGGALDGGTERWAPLRWRDPATGLELCYEAGLLSADEAPLWDPPREVRPGGPEGPGADADAALDPPDPERLDEEESAVVNRFEAALRADGLSESTVRRHVGNARAWVDFLALTQQVPLRAATEFDLRVFLYDWFPRKALDARSRAMALPGSLRRFFRFATRDQGVRWPWAEALLTDREPYQARYESCPGDVWWDEEVEEWRDELYEDLDERAMLHDPEMESAGAWDASMGAAEARLERELQRRWLIWREEAIRAGIARVDDLRLVLVARQREWERAPHPGLGGKTPAQVVRRSRRRMGS